MDHTKSAVEIYDKIAKDYAESFVKKEEEEEIIEEFLQMLPKGARLLDVGCGTADYFDFIAKHDLHYTGIDLSKEMIKVAREKHKDGEFYVQDMRKMDFPESVFDGIFCFNALIHMPMEEVKIVVADFHAVLKQGGKIIISVQEGEGEDLVDEAYLPNQKIFLRRFTEQELTDILTKHGFKVLKSTRRLLKTHRDFGYSRLYAIAQKL